MNKFYCFSRSLKVQFFSLVLIFCLSLTSVFGQTDTTKKIKTKPFVGLEFTSTMALALEMLDYSGYITVTNNKSYFALGPVIGKERMVATYWWGDQYTLIKMDDYSLNGFNFIYQITPNLKAKVFDFFFQYKFNFLSFKNRNIQQPVNLEYPEGYFESPQFGSLLQRITQNYIGYGFKLKILNNFYFTQSVNVGLLTKRTTVDSDSEATTFFIEDKIRRGPDIMVNLGMGYNFQKRTKTKYVPRETH